MRIRLDSSHSLNTRLKAYGYLRGSAWWVIVGPQSSSTSLFVLPPADIRQQILTDRGFSCLYPYGPMTLTFRPLRQELPMNAVLGFPTIMNDSIFAMLTYNGTQRYVAAKYWRSDYAESSTVYNLFIEESELEEFCNKVAEYVCTQLADFAAVR